MNLKAGQYVKVIGTQNPDYNKTTSDFSYGNTTDNTGAIMQIVKIVDDTYYYCRNIGSEYGECYLYEEDAVESYAFPKTKAEIISELGIEGELYLDSEADSIEYPTKASLASKVIELANGTKYYCLGQVLFSTKRVRSLDEFDDKLMHDNVALHINKIYDSCESNGSSTDLNTLVGELDWARPTIMTLDEINDKLGYEVEIVE